MLLQFKGREVEVNGVSGTYEEPFIEEAGYTDGAQEALTDAEMDELTELNFEAISDEAYQNMVMKAEYAAEGDR